jgi:hypothetical protein
MQSFRSLTGYSRMSPTINNPEAVKRGHFLLSSFELLVISSLLPLKEDGSVDDTWKTDDTPIAELERRYNALLLSAQKVQQTAEQKPPTLAKSAVAMSRVI